MTAGRPPIRGLTRREKQIMALIAQASTNREIADHFCLNMSTVTNHIQHIQAKLNLKNRVAIAVYAVQHESEVAL